MKFIAITGSIGCGKTTIARIIRQSGYVVYDVDAWVRRMYFKKSFIAEIAAIFPQVMVNGAVDKRRLRNLVFNNQQELQKLENITHPFLKKYLKQVIRSISLSDGIFFIDVALLYELNLDKYCDIVVVADVDYEIQKQRVMKRDKVEAEDFDKINNIQIDNKIKKQMADIVINTDKPYNLLRLEVITMIDYIERM